MMTLELARLRDRVTELRHALAPILPKSSNARSQDQAYEEVLRLIDEEASRA